MVEVASVSPRPPPCRSCWTPPNRGIEAGPAARGRQPILNSVNLEDGDAVGNPPRPLLDPGSRVRGRGWFARVSTRRAKPARAEHKVAAARPSTTWRQPLRPRPRRLAFRPAGLTLGTGMEESRGDGPGHPGGHPPHQSGMPGVHTILGLSNISFGLAPAARTSQLGVPATAARRRDSTRHRACQPDHATQQDRSPRRGSVRRPDHTGVTRPRL